MEIVTILLGIAVIIGTILIIRLLGAWMLRVNEVITLLREILNTLRGR